MQALTVTGVTRHFDHPPRSVTTADLPAAFPMMPNGARREAFSTCVALDKVRTMDYIICIEPVGQATQPENYGAIAALMDNLETALDAEVKDMGGSDLSNYIEYQIFSNTTFVIARNQYWAIIATVTSRESP